MLTRDIVKMHQGQWVWPCRSLERQDSLGTDGEKGGISVLPEKPWGKDTEFRIKMETGSPVRKFPVALLPGLLIF